VGKNRSTVANALRLLRLPPRIQASLRDGSLSAGHARMLVTIEDEPTQLRLHRQILDKGLSVREVERITREVREGAPAPSEAAASSNAAPVSTPSTAALTPRDRLEIEGYEARMREHLGTRIEIRHAAESDSGTIEIAYFSKEDLERLVELIASY
jgi:ParB family chromosome partitioning protein